MDFHHKLDNIQTMSFSYISTGLSSGLGSFAKEYLDSEHPDWHHIMLCRNPSQFDGKNTTAIKVDLDSIESTIKACKKVKRLVETGEVPPPKYFLGNAGVKVADRTSKTIDGFEKCFHVNVIANYVLLKELLPIMTGDGVRVFITGSKVHYGGQGFAKKLLPPPHWNDDNLDEVLLPIATTADKDPKSYKAGSRAYVNSKLGVNYLIFKVARDHPEVKCMSYEPGFSPGSGLWNNQGAFEKAMTIFMSKIAPHLTKLVVPPKKAGTNIGKYFSDDELWSKIDNATYCDQGVITKASNISFNESRQDNLWEYLDVVYSQYISK